MKKITRTTIKSFIKNNIEKMYISEKSSFDGMYDCVMLKENQGFEKVFITENLVEKTLGIAGAWFVGGGRDSYDPFNENGFTGFTVWNCCGEFTIAVKG